MADCRDGLQCIASKCIDLSSVDIGAAVEEQMVKAQSSSAYINAVKLEIAVETYKLNKNDVCPASGAELVAAGILPAAALKDPWGGDYVIACPGKDHPVEVHSLGPDKQPGGGDDIKSWEAP